LDKKQIAALVGVWYYLREEERKRIFEASNIKPYSMMNRWAIYGRQTIMQLRKSVQGRLLNNHMPLSFLTVTVPVKGVAQYRVRNVVITRNRIKTQARIQR
jgi:hypothetical protein